MSLFVDIEKSYGSFHLKVSFQTEDNTLAFLGASGSGKSLTLKCIAGLERPDRGRIIINGRTVFDSERKIDLKPQERRAGLLFQNYALFPHMTVWENVLAGATHEKDKEKRKRKAEMLLERFDLTQYIHRLPFALSGGQQQRVALARILVSEPEIILLDEPFSALDSHLRSSMEQELRQVLRSFGKTVLLVSHNRNEVYRLSDRVAIIHNGCVIEHDLKDRIFDQPQGLFTAQLLGVENILPIRDEIAEIVIPTEKCITHIGIRGDDLMPSKHGISCYIIDRIEEPRHIIYLLEYKSSILRWKLEKSSDCYKIGQTVSLLVPQEKILLLTEREIT